MDPQQQQPTQPQTPNEPQAPAPQPYQPSQESNALNTQPPVPTQQAEQPPQPAAQQMSPRKTHKKLALALLITPTALIIIAIISAILAGQLSASTAPTDGTFGDTPVAVTIFNVIGFAGMALGVLTWLPGLIVGIILLARKK